MTEQFSDGFTTTLAAAITSTVRPVTFTVAATSPDLPSGTFSIIIYDVGTEAAPTHLERLEVTSVTGTSWTASTESTSTATTHALGSTVRQILSKRSLLQLVADHIALADPHTQYVRKATLTAKGDAFAATGSATIAREAVGADGTVLTADSTTPTGRSWKSAGLAALTTIGDMAQMIASGIARLAVGSPGQILSSARNAALIADPTAAPTLANVAGANTWVASTSYLIGYTYVLGLPGGQTGETLLSPTVTYASGLTPSVQAVTTPAFPALPAGTTASAIQVYVGTVATAMHLVATLSAPSTSTTNVINVSGPNAGGAAPPTINATGGVSPAWINPRNVATKTAAYTLLATDDLIQADATTVGFTVTLPLAAAVVQGKRYSVKKIDSTANVVTIAAAGADTIDGTATRALVSQFATLDIVSDGVSKWLIDPLSGISNPMTAVGDLITGGTAGAPSRLGPPGPAGNVLTSNGTLTPPSWQPATGGGGGGVGGGAMVPLQVFQLSAAQASVVFTVPQTFRNLRIVWQARGDTAATSTLLNLQVNGDTAANYDRELLSGSAAAAFVQESLAQTTLAVGEVAASTAPAGAAGSGEIKIANYSGTTFRKAINAQSEIKKADTTGNLATEVWGGEWRNTAAVTSVTLAPAAGNFISGSVFVLWGEADQAAALPAANSSLIQEVTLGAVATSIVLSNIPQTYRDLRITFNGRSDSAGVTLIRWSLQFNADAGANYDFLTRDQGNATNTTGAAATSGDLGQILAATAPAGVSASSVITIPDYTDAAWQKTYLAQTGEKNANTVSGPDIHLTSGNWRSTAAITSITLLPASGNFVVGTVVRLYGEPASSLPKIGESVLSAAAASVVFNAIPQTYRNLRVEWQARGTNVAAQVLNCQFNGDTAANYDIYGAGALNTQTALRVGVVNATGDTVGRANAGRFEVRNYTATTYHKMLVDSQCARSDTQVIDSNAGTWKNTAAVTSLTLSPAAGTFDIGSVFTLYGEP